MPAEVAFHFNVADRLDYAARLLRKASAQGASCQVLATPDDLRSLDEQLWVRFADEFLAHSVDDDPPAVRQHSPIHLGQNALADRTVRVVLDGGEPARLMSGVHRVIEIVGSDNADRERGRQRWRSYRQLGIEPQQHDLAGKR